MAKAKNKKATKAPKDWSAHYEKYKERYRVWSRQYRKKKKAERDAAKETKAPAKPKTPKHPLPSPEKTEPTAE